MTEVILAVAIFNEHQCSILMQHTRSHSQVRQLVKDKGCVKKYNIS